ncbi:MAG: porin [Candidatus Methylomirabilales bacterium]
MGPIRAVLFMAGLALLLAPPSVWAADPQVEALEKELKVRDKVIEQLMQRMERLEKEVREGQKVQMVPAALQAPASAATAKPETPSLSERLKALEDSSVIKFFKETEISGYVAATYNQNLNNPEPQDNRFHVFDLDANTFTFNAAELLLIKPSTAESPLGFGLDVSVGHDARVFSADWTGDGTSDTNTFELVQGYVTYKAPVGEGLDIKFGKFVTLLGAEVINRTANFNISRSYLFGFAIPFTNTGLLLSYPFDSTFTVTAGVVNGWDNVIDNNDAKTFMGQAVFTPAEVFSVAVNGIWGAEQNNNSNNARWVIEAVPTFKPFKDFTLLGDFLYGQEANVPSIGGQDAQWWGVALVANYNFTEKFGVAVRGEYFRDAQGVRTGATVPTDPTQTLVGADLYEASLTLYYKFFDHVLARLEYRYDFSGGDNLFFGSPGDNQNILQVEVIYMF